MGTDDSNKLPFEEWLTPGQALEALPWDFETCASAIHGRLKAGIIRAAAEVARWQGKDNSRALIPKKAWEGWACIADVAFWRTGDTTFWGFDSTGYGISASNGFEVYGTRFYPGDIARLVPAENKATDDQPDGERAHGGSRPDLPDALLNDWAALFNRANPDATEAKAREAIEAMFPKNHVTVRRLRRVLPERQRGRPLENKGK